MLRPDDEARILIAQSLKLWLGNNAVPGNDERVKALGQQIDKMVKELAITIDDDQHFSIKTGTGEDVLTLLDRGSLWFPPHPDVVREITDAYLR